MASYSKEVKRLVVTDKELVSVAVDPTWETADVDNENNIYPRRIIPSRVEAYKYKRSVGKNSAGRDIMHDITTKLKTDEDKKDGEKEEDKKD